MSIQDIVRIKQKSLSQYINTSEEEFLAATAKEGMVNKWNGETSEQLKNRLKLQHLWSAAMLITSTVEICIRQLGRVEEIV